MAFILLLLMNSIGGCVGECRFSLVLFTRLATLLHQLCDHACPSCLVAGSDAAARISVKVLVEQDQVAPVRVGLKFLEISEDRAPSVLVLQEYAGHAARKFTGNFPQRQHLP